MLRIAEQWHGSDLGRQRQGNEDNYFVRAPLFVVADGMGGAQAGEVASEMAVESFDRGLPDGQEPATALVQVIEDANRRIHERSRADHQRAGMGTTVTAAYVGADTVTVAHVGDSRAYLLRDGDLIRLTRDHSLVGELVARGKLTEEQAEAHPQRSVITRALGPEPKVQVDVEVFPARGGDVFMLCSDGLTSMVHEPDLKQLLTSGAPLGEVGPRLIDAANDAGGRDNITVLLFRLEAVERVAPAEPAQEETSEYDTFEGDAVPAPRQGMSGPQAATRVRDEEALDAAAVRAGVRASDEQEAAYRAAGTVAMPALRPRPPAQPIDESPPPPAPVPAARRPPRRRRIRPGVVIALVAVLLLLGGLWTATREVYFLGIDRSRGDVVTIYRGLPYDLPFGISLYSPVAGSGVTLRSVPPTRRREFTDHQWRSRADAESLVRALELGALK